LCCGMLCCNVVWQDKAGQDTRQDKKRKGR
jgi:hypothetical protein